METSVVLISSEKTTETLKAVNLGALAQASLMTGKKEKNKNKT